MRHKWFVMVILVVLAAPSWALDRGAVYRVWPRVIENSGVAQPVQLGVIEDSQVNAFAIPRESSIYVYTGLVNTLQTDGQLAWVLAHELGHITKNHTGEKMARSPLRKPLLLILGAAAGYYLGGKDANGAFTGAQVGGGLTKLQWSRLQEREADSEGNVITQRAGFDPTAGSQVMEIFARQGGRMPQWLSSHPNPKERGENNKKWLAANPQPTITRLATGRRTIIVQFDGSLYDPWMARTFLQVMGQSSKLRVVAYGGDRQEIMRAQQEFGINPQTTRPQDLWLVAANADYRYGSGGASIGTPWGGVGYYKNGDKLIASLVATPYHLTTGELKGAEALIASGEARMSGGSSTSIWVPQGSIGWQGQSGRGYPQGEAFQKACEALRERFEALPVETQPTGLPTSGVERLSFPIPPGSYARVGEVWTIVADGQAYPVSVIEVIGDQAYYAFKGRRPPGGTYQIFPPE